MIKHLAIAAITIFALSACGDAEADEKAEAKKQAKADIEHCQEEIGEFIDALVDIDARLNVGLTIVEYGDYLADASVERRHLDEDDLSEDCEDALKAGDIALDQYSSIHSSWDDCIWADWCDPEDLGMSEDWVEAGEDVAKAEALMDGEPLDGEDA